MVRYSAEYIIYYTVGCIFAAFAIFLLLLMIRLASKKVRFLKFVSGIALSKQVLLILILLLVVMVFAMSNKENSTEKDVEHVFSNLKKCDSLELNNSCVNYSALETIEEAVLLDDKKQVANLCSLLENNRYYLHPRHGTPDTLDWTTIKAKKGPNITESFTLYGPRPILIYFDNDKIDYALEAINPRLLSEIRAAFDLKGWEGNYLPPGS